MTKNYYCSGFDNEECFKERIAEKLKNDLDKTERIVYIAATDKQSSLEKSISVYIPRFNQHLENIGINFKDFKFITPEVSAKDAKNWIENSNMVFLLGGDPFVQREIIESKKIIENLKNYEGVILGASAGAMNMSKYIIITPCSEEYPDFLIKEGLNLSNISIYPHVNFEGFSIPQTIDLDGEIITMEDLVKVSKDYESFYCLQDHFYEDRVNSSFIYEKDGEIEFIVENDGKVILVDDKGFNFVENIKMR